MSFRFVAAGAALLGMSMNTPGMARGSADSTGRFEVLLGK